MMKVRTMLRLSAAACLSSAIVPTTALAQSASATRQQAPGTGQPAALLANPAPAAAETPPQEPTGPADAQDASGALPDIVVTAQRRAENLQRVPIAVTAVTGEALVTAGITNTLQLGAIAPSFNARTGNGAFNPYIRGIGSPSNVVESPVALYIDGVYLAQAREGLRELNDIAQLAVLKGPQGTLFGRNATGGVIQITTQAPSHTFRAEMGAEIDNYQTVKTDGYVTGPLSDTLAFSASGQYVKQFEGYGTNYTTGNDTYQLRKQITLRGKLLYQPQDGTDITLIADYMDREARPNAFQPTRGTTFSIPGLGPYDDRYDTYSGLDDYANFQGGGVSLTVDQELGFAKLVSISAYRKGDSESLFVPSGDRNAIFYIQTPDSPNESFSQELQLVSSPGRFNWVVGAFYFEYENANNPVSVFLRGVLSPAPFSPARFDNFGVERTESIAPFGQVNWELIDGLTVTGGVRWTYERRRAELSRSIAFNNGRTISGGALNDSTTFKEPTYRGALAYQFNPDILAYVSYNTGFKSGGFNITNAVNPSYAPEKLKSWEAGFKSEILNDRVRLNLALYHYDYSNIQLTRFGEGSQFVVNAASAELYGLDLDIEAQVADGLRVTGGLALEHSEFTRYPNAIFSTRQPNGSIMTTAADVSGNRLPLAQEISATLAMDYHADLSSGALDANITANYNDDYFFEADNQVLRQPEYLNLNASIKYTLPGERVSFRLFAKNLLDEAVLSYPVTQAFGTDANYSPPRTYGIAARINF